MEPKFNRTRRSTTLSTTLQLSLSINLVLAFSLLYLFLVAEECTTSNSYSSGRKDVTETATVWYGGHPAEDRYGSCWCSEDKYCMCTPNLAIDLVITSGRRNIKGVAIVESFWLVRRKDTNQLATMGGFVEVNESVEDAVKRELMEEMGVTLKEAPTLVGMYSDPRRDNRRRTASVVFAVHFPAGIQPRAGDDAKEVVKIPIDDVEIHSYFADHGTILLDYRSALRGEGFEQHRMEGEFSGGVTRSTCGILNAM